MGTSSSSEGIGHGLSSPVSRASGHRGNQTVSSPVGHSDTSPRSSDSSPTNPKPKAKNSSAARGNRGTASRGVSMVYALGNRGREVFVDDILGIPEGTAQRSSPEELSSIITTAVATTYSLIQSTHQNRDPENNDTAMNSRLALERRLYLLLALQESVLGGGIPAGERSAIRLKQDNAYKHEHQLSRIISRCPLITFTDKMLETSVSVGGRENSEDRGTCVVCWEDYLVGDVIMLLPCFHQLHEKCCRDWLSRKSECPTCQINIMDSFRRSLETQ
eukprot:Tbor_TRINITY_DN2589_c0_g1::TRINITY_DN2589_c0_g1_i1::g.478::m.478